MKKSKSIKRWRLNVVVSYNEPQLVNNYRTDILNLLKHLASIYRLDYAISEEHPFPAFSDSYDHTEHKIIADLIYFRSNDNSRVDKKKLKHLIGYMFDAVPSLFFEGVDIFSQLYKALPEYPFPKDFYRPLIYPLVEYYKDSTKTLYIHAGEVMKVIEKEQDYPLN